MKGKEIAIIIVGGVCLAAMIYLFTLGGLENVQHLIRRPRIEVRSLNRPHADEWFTGETLVFALVNAETERVFWLFDDEHIDRGGVQIEHAFTYDKEKSPGIISHHRVDAFFRAGRSYTTASCGVSVGNLVANLTFDDVGKMLRLTGASDLQEHWDLVRVTVSEYLEDQVVTEWVLWTEGGPTLWVSSSESGLKTVEWRLTGQQASKISALLRGDESLPAELIFADPMRRQELLVTESVELSG